MTAKLEKDKAKQLQDKCQTVLNGLLRDEDNKYCVDCDSKGPRWASWNLGVFLCIRCAGIHRNLGVHISKVKSVNLDSWTPEQVVSLQQMGNSRARAVYEANLPDNFRRPQNDSSLESFIRAKYEHKKYIAREWVAPPLPKVNWEKEIEEEMERQKRKKKTVVEKKIINNVQVPQLPKPKNPSPKAGRSQTSNTTTITATETKQGDLLNIQNGGEDNFSGFLSAPVAEEKKPDEKDPIQSEEESFFNQTAPPEKEKVKLTKDSILALYGNTPTNTNFTPAYQNPLNSGGFPQNFAVQGNFQTFPGVVAPPAQAFPAVLPQQQQQQQQFVGNSQWGQFVQSNQFAGGFPTTAATTTQFSAVAAPVQYGQPVQQNAGFATPNPFGGIPAATASVQQQFAALNLGNQANSAASNLWQ